MSVEESKGAPEKSERHIQSKVADKFRAYRLLAQSTDAKLREAETVIEELKNEINFSRNAEKNLRIQISSTQNRLLSLQETVKKFINISDQQRQNEKTCQTVQERIQEFEKDIDEIRQKSQNLLRCTTKELELLNKVKELESILETKNSESDLMKMEIRTLTKEKTNMETEFREKLKNLENTLENLKKKETEAQIHYRESLLYYKHQMEEHERKIDRYEQERKSFLEDFAPPRASEDKITMADSTVSINPEKRSLTFKKRNKTQMDLEESEDKIFHCSPIVGKSRVLTSKKSRTFSKKQKPQLEFLTQESSLNLEGTSRKRRLFSANNNHYVDYFDDKN